VTNGTVTPIAGVSNSTKQMPYWWEEAPDAFVKPCQLPAETDVAIIGSGLTGCSAATHLARSGRHVTVVDAVEIGHGAASRNAGFVGQNSRYTYTKMCKKFGQDFARRYFTELRDIYQAAIATIETEGLDAGLQRTGRVAMSLSKEHFEERRADAERRIRELGDRITFLGRDEMAAETGSPLPVRGIKYDDMAMIHPGLYARAMARRAEAAGATCVAKTRVTGLSGAAGNWVLETTQGKLRAAHVIVATNGYTDGAFPWLVRRLVPIRAYMVATEPLPDIGLKTVLSGMRNYGDGRKFPNYMRRSPDGTRLLMGGETGRMLENDLPEIARRLNEVIEIYFPQIAGIGLSHVWTGRCASTFDQVPKVGEHGGIVYALGLNFSGNAMGPYLGGLAARLVMGERPDSIFVGAPFPGFPAYRGFPWAVQAMRAWYTWRQPLPRRPALKGIER
jgi:glycine/D-amino acid oxidase-like deaminating enzyme